MRRLQRLLCSTIPPEILSVVQEQEGDDKQGFRRIERGFGKFVRRFQLPENTDPEHIQVRTAK